jgi:pimeloyl-ACP methyl ester carboxylesterase
MSWKGRAAAAAAGIAGVAAAGTAAGVVRHRRVIENRDPSDARLGSLRSTPLTVLASDGVELHVEIDEVPGANRALPGRRKQRTPLDDVTLVFVHGFTLNLDCWHFQRAGFRGQVRSVFFDLRSHGRSGRSDGEHSTIEQCADDLFRVINEVAPEGRIVLAGHSMGGMTIIALAEAHPELFGDRIVGVALVATTAGGLSPAKMVLPFIPEGVGGEVARRLMAALARTSRVVEGVRRVTTPLAMVFTDMFAFGDEVPASYIQFVDSMISQTHFDVLAEFFPSFESLDKFAVIHAFEKVPTEIVCGTDDKVTSIGHSRKMHSLLPESTLTEAEGAGHLVIMERHEIVNAAIDRLLFSASTLSPGPLATAGRSRKVR